MEEKTRLKHTALTALLWVLVALSLVGAGTYAWFTFNSTTRVDALPGQMTERDTEVVTEVITETVTETVTETITETVFNYLPDEPRFEISSDSVNYGEDCNLVLDGNDGTLEPVSTNNLNSFYTATAQLPNGISVRFKDATSVSDKMTMHGKVWLRMTQMAAPVYFDKDKTSFTGDAQTLAALRLGIKVSKNGGAAETKIFKLDAMGDTSTASAHQTVNTSGTVISSIDSEGKANLVSDPAESIGSYLRGETPVINMDDGDVAEVEYWVYLEGCDDNCYNPVQQKAISLQFGFTNNQ